MEGRQTLAGVRNEVHILKIPTGSPPDQFLSVHGWELSLAGNYFTPFNDSGDQVCQFLVIHEAVR